MNYNGLIIKGIGGFYYVETSEGIFECKAKGIFRKNKITPVAGDRVRISVNVAAENTIDEIFERKNLLVRPPVSNLDALFIVVSTCEPAPNTVVIDKMTVLAEKNNIEPVLIFTKTDKKSSEDLIAEYKKTKYKIFSVSINDHSQLDEIKNYISGKLVAFTGNSGAGKSTLINALCPELQLSTADISNKLGRGRHTTRQAEIFHIGDGLVIDTAGFSAVDLLSTDVILKEDLQFYFSEFSDYIDQCRFTGCAHLNDKGCKICEMVQSGLISQSRHESYKILYNDAKAIKKWEL
ncbi:MAG: ribosome small subunit-dependent GTPase A [Clostridia bacterium]|nr:ribosome small subunit-dependent GTPase A [Clostridia bacterium]